MSSRPSPEAIAADPTNIWLHSMRVRRLQGEAIRDAMLSVSGRLDRTYLGKSVPVYLSPHMIGRGRPKSGPMDGNGRRTIYIGVRRNFLSSMMLAFDTPQPFSTVGWVPGRAGSPVWLARPAGSDGCPAVERPVSRDVQCQGIHLYQLKAVVGPNPIASDIGDPQR